MLKLMGKKMVTVYTQKFCLSKPVVDSDSTCMYWLRNEKLSSENDSFSFLNQYIHNGIMWVLKPNNTEMLFFHS